MRVPVEMPRLGYDTEVGKIGSWTAKVGDTAVAKAAAVIAPSVVTIDSVHRGVGTASCGPDTLDSYKIRPGVHKFTWSISQV